MRVKILLETQHDVINFVNIASYVQEDVFITDGNGLKVNGKSLMGVMYALEFDDLTLETEEDNYNLFKNYII